MAVVSLQRGEDTMQQNPMTTTSQECAGQIAYLLQQAQRECRIDTGQVNDPKAQALFETVAEVLGGTIKVLNDYRLGIEQAWQSTGYTTQAGAAPPTTSDLAVDVDAAKPPPRVNEILPHEHGQQRPS